MIAMRDALTPVCTIVGKSWDFHVTDVLGAALDENLEMIADSVEFLAQSSEIIYDAEHFFDGYKERIRNFPGCNYLQILQDKNNPNSH